jgi:hypothetical protein
MRASVGDELLVHGKVVGQHDSSAQILEVLGKDGKPPYRVRFEDGHEAVMLPGPDAIVRHVKGEA